MSLIGNVLSGLLGGQGGGSGLQNVLTGMLGGQGAGGQGVNQGGMARPGSLDQGGFGGGLGGLVSAFQQAGLGDVFNSWVGHGQNQSVSPDQLQNVFGQQRVNDMASQSGMSSSDFLSQLSQHLPRAVDGMTPNGQLPDEGTVSV